MKVDKDSLTLYAITDRSWVGSSMIESQVESALKGGATCIQLREKNLGEEAFLGEAFRLSSLCRRYGVLFVVNDNVGIAIQSGADGVHVGQEDMAAVDVRRMIGDRMFLGVSVHSLEQAVSAEQNGADYLAVGPVFSSSNSSEPDSKKIERDTIKTICRSVSVPVIAVGGINMRNITELSGLGLSGVALVSAVFASKDIENECRILRRIIEKSVKSL